MDVETAKEVPRKRERRLSTASVFTNPAFDNLPFDPEQATQVGDNRFMIQRRGTKIFVEGFPEMTRFHQPSISSSEAEEAAKLEHLHQSSPLISGLYAMLLFDIGLVLKISQFITEDITTVEFYWFMIFVYTVGSLWMALYQPLATGCYKHQERISFAKSNHVNNRWLKGVLILFGLAIVVKDGLVFIAYLTINPSVCKAQGLYAVLPICNTVFLILQISYLFKHSKVFTQDFQVLTNFGIFHVIATNLTIWIALVIDETNAALQHSGGEDSSTHAIDPFAEHTSTEPSLVPFAGSHHSEILFHGNCTCNSTFCETVAVAQTFLFPFVIEFSLVASCLLYITWKNIGKAPPVCQYIIKPSYKLHGSYKGALSGSLVMLSTILVIVLLGSNGSEPPIDQDGSWIDIVLVYTIFYIVLESCMVLLTLFGFYLYMKIQQESKEESEHLDAVLLILCLVGPLILGMFSLFGVALSDDPHNHKWGLSFVLPLIDILQCMSQVVFLLAGLHRKPITSIEGQEAAAELGRSVDKAITSTPAFPESIQRQSMNQTSGVVANRDLMNSFDSEAAAQDAVTEQVTSFCAEQIVNKMKSPRVPLKNPALDSVEEERESQAEDEESASASTSDEKDFSFTQSDDFDPPPFLPQMKVVTEEQVTPPDRNRRFLRDIMMFLLISNACLWVFLSLEGTAFDMQSYQDKYYGGDAWTIISMICRPLNIFFRMHSAACLFEVWSFA